MPIEPRPIDPSLLERLRELHAQNLLAGDPPNALLSLPDDQLLYIVALLRNEPRMAPERTPAEWEVFLKSLQPHRAFALIAYHLQTWPEECRPPKKFAVILDQLFLQASGRAFQAGRQIQPIIDAIEGAGIPLALLKGPALGRTIHPLPALRQSGDIDILVRPSDVLAAEEALGGIGYRCVESGFLLSEHQYYHDILRHPRGGMRVELHWALDGSFNLFPFDWVDHAMARRMPIRSADLSFHTLDHVDHLLFLVYHNLFYHDSVQLADIIDIARMVAGFTDPVEWKDVIGHAVANHLRIPLGIALDAAALWVGAGIPDDVVTMLAESKPLEREVQLWKHVQRRHDSLSSQLFLNMQGQPGVLEKVRCGYRFILPPTPTMACYRQSDSRYDLLLAHLRRWARLTRYN